MIIMPTMLRAKLELRTYMRHVNKKIVITTIGEQRRHI